MSSVNPYQAPQARVDDVATQLQAFVLAERSTRVGAIFIDGAIFMVPFVAVVMPLMMLITPQGGDTATWMLWIMGIASIVMLAVFAVNLVFWHRYGQSIGKRILKIKIIRSDGSRAGLGRIFFLRVMIPVLIGVIPIAGNLFSVVDPLMIFRDSRKCLHDNIADTVVVKV